MNQKQKRIREECSEQIFEEIAEFYKKEKEKAELLETQIFNLNKSNKNNLTKEQVDKIMNLKSILEKSSCLV